jgi:hypothetical protein
MNDDPILQKLGEKGDMVSEPSTPMAARMRTSIEGELAGLSGAAAQLRANYDGSIDPEPRVEPPGVEDSER